MKVRIRQTPQEREIDGIKLNGLAPGDVREVSSTVAAWLIAEGYAEPEMRATTVEPLDSFSDMVGRPAEQNVEPQSPATDHDRRSSDRLKNRS